MKLPYAYKWRRAFRLRLYVHHSDLWPFSKRRVIQLLLERFCGCRIIEESIIRQNFLNTNWMSHRDEIRLHISNPPTTLILFFREDVEWQFKISIDFRRFTLPYLHSTKDELKICRKHAAMNLSSVFSISSCFVRLCRWEFLTLLTDFFKQWADILAGALT